MVDFASTALLPFALLVIALSFVAAILSDKLRASYTTVLIAMGFALSFLRIAGGLQSIPLDNTVILGLVVPPLIFEAAMRTRYEVFRAIHKTVWALAIFGVIVSAIVSGLVLNVALGLPLAVALTFGVIVAPTDPVSVVNILKKTKAPEGLTTLLETEAYFNNAPAVILFPIVTSLSFSPLQSASAFVYNFGGGAIVGLLISGGAELLYRMITEPLAETSFTIAVMFGSYILAESLGVSGLTAVAIAGLYMGNRTMQTAMSDETRTTVSKFWEVMTFLASSFALLLLGLNTDFSLLMKFAPLVGVAFGAILVARAISVYPITAVTRLMREMIPERWIRILAVSGLRGVLSVALALSLPESGYKETIVVMTFGVALLSLVVQGELLQLYLRSQRFGEGRETVPATADMPV
jgi:CPA1 family monovalent cation:H+ antiporter